MNRSFRGAQPGAVGDGTAPGPPRRRIPPRPPQRRRRPAGRVVEGLDPGCFALVMATGIVSQAMMLDGAHSLSALLLAAGTAAYAVLAAATTWRLATCRPQMVADALDPARGPGLFTFVAASDVLAARLAADGHGSMAAGLLAVGAAAWLMLSGAAPLALLGWRGPPPALAKANGGWFLWAVATASVAVAAASLPSAAGPAPGSPVLPGTVPDALAVCCWSIAIVLYLLTAATVTVSLLAYRRRPADITPPYWIFMGASAICVLAGARILQLPPGPLTAAVRGIVPGACLALWAFGTWLIPLLVAAGIWRHVVHRVPPRYEPGLWSIVFPLGMNSVAARELGGVLSVPWLTRWGGIEAWFALAAWLAVSLALLAHLTVAVARPEV